VFLEHTKGNWEPAISKKWDCTFANADFKRDLDLEPYQYNMVRWILQSSFEFILNKKHQLCQSKVTDINELENHVL
jgi:lycopene beta-cyclase